MSTRAALLNSAAALNTNICTTTLVEVPQPCMRLSFVTSQPHQPQFAASLHTPCSLLSRVGWVGVLLLLPRVRVPRLLLPAGWRRRHLDLHLGVGVGVGALGRRVAPALLRRRRAGRVAAVVGLLHLGLAVGLLLVRLLVAGLGGWVGWVGGAGEAGEGWRDRRSSTRSGMENKVQRPANAPAAGGQSPCLRCPG